MSWWAAAAWAGGTLLDMYGSSQSAAAEMDLMIAESEALAADAEALEESLTDQINVMERRIERGISSARANIGASGVEFSGSALNTLIQMHGIGREDMEAAFRARSAAVNRKYLEAINRARGARATGRVAQYELAGRVFQAGFEAYQYRDELGFNELFT